MSGDGPTHWARMGERGSVWGLKLMLFIYRALGRTIFSLILYPVMAYYWLTVARAREGSLQYLKRLGEFAPGLKLKATWAASYEHFYALGQVMLDKVLIFAGGLELSEVKTHSRELMYDRVKRGEGGLCLAAHLGNLEAMQALSENNEHLRLTILVHTKHAESFNRVLQEVKPTRKPNLIEVSDFTPAVALDLAERVARGEWIVIAADRVPVSSDRRIEASFLGATAAFPAGPHVLGGVLGCPMIFAVALKESDGYHVYYELLTEQLAWSRSTRDAALAESVQKFADRLAYYCQRAPLQWFNFYPFWQKT